MRAGRLKHRVKLQRYNVTKDSYGQDIEAWVDIATVWADFLPKRSREFYAEQQVNAELTAVLSIRYRDDVSERDRVLYVGRTYEVIGQPINIEMRNRELQISVRELA